MTRFGAGGEDLDRPEYPDTVANIGEDPARYLYDRPRWVALARIRGIHKLAVVAAFRAVELNLARQQDVREEPRDWVLEVLDEREAYLEEHGEFDPDVDHAEPETGPYTPDQWQRDPGGLPPITPHESNIARPATDGGEDGDQA